MIDTINLQPPGFGLRADPQLFGVSEGLLRLFPLPVADEPAAAVSEPSSDVRADPTPAVAYPAAEA